MPETAPTSIPKIETIPNLIAVVAVTPSGVIGRDGEMPWRLGSDLRRFKRLTMGGVLVMGRKTFESIGKPLPGRKTIVITRNQNWSCDGVQVVDSPVKAIQETSNSLVPSQTFVVGGAQIYDQLIPFCEAIWLTRVWSNTPGDTELKLDLTEFRVTETSRVPATAKDSVPTEFSRLNRKKR